MTLNEMEYRHNYLHSKGKVQNGTVVTFRYPNDYRKASHQFTYDSDANKWHEVYTYVVLYSDAGDIISTTFNWISGSETNLGWEPPVMIGKEDPPGDDCEDEKIVGIQSEAGSEKKDDDKK